MLALATVAAMGYGEYEVPDMQVAGKCLICIFQNVY